MAELDQPMRPITARSGTPRCKTGAAVCRVELAIPHARARGAGVRREVPEETGGKEDIERLSGVHKNMPRGIVALVLRCHSLGAGASSTDEARRIAWLTVEQITEHMDPAYAVRVTDALADDPVIRVHDGDDLITA